MKDSAAAARSLFSTSIRSRVQQDEKDSEAGENGEETGAEAALPDKIDPLPRPGDAYKVHGRHGNKPDLTLHFVTRDFAYEGFSYGDLERVRLVPGDSPGSGDVLIICFNATEVTMEGRHLHGLYNWIGLHRVPWVAEHPSPAEFTDEKAELISRISFRQVER